MRETPNYDVLGIGSPMIDHIIRVDEEYVQSLEGGKGGMVPISYHTMNAILEKFHGEATLTIGGSAANTIKGLAQLGNRCLFLGKTGKDPSGATFSKRLKELGITPLLTATNTPTAHSLCLVTPDGERSMRTYLGAGQEMEAKELHPSHFTHVRLVHLEGYNLLKEELTETAMQMAKEAGALVSIDLASYEIVKTHRERLLTLIKNYTDIVIANANESWALTGLPPKESCHAIQKLCKTAVVLFGEGGCWIGQNDTIIHGVPFPNHPVDTTGAGDLFTSGFLHAYLKGSPLSECAQLGNILGSAVVGVLGTEIPQTMWEKIKSRI